MNRGGMYSVEITNTGDSVMKAKSKDAEILIDTKGQGINPPDVLLASIGSCLGVYIRKYAEGTGLRIPGFNLRINAGFSEEKPVYFKKISIDVDLNGAEIDEHRKKSILSFIKNCPVHTTLKNSPVIDINIK